MVAEHRRLLQAAFAAHGGCEVDNQGDSFFVAFRSAHEAVAAATAAQRALEAHDWPDGERVRMGVHTGRAEPTDGRYHGVAVHRGARIMAAAHGGQVLVSQTTRELLADEEADTDGLGLRDLGERRLKDLDQPVRLYQVTANGLQERFPPVRTADTRRRRLLHTRRGRVALAAVGLVVVGAAAVGVLVASGSSAPTAVRLQPDSIAVIDAKAGSPVADVPLGFAPDAVVANGDRVWVSNYAGQPTVTPIDPRTLRSLPTVGVGAANDWVALSGATLWVGVSGGVEMVGPGSTAVSKIPLWKPQPSCGISVAGVGGTVWASQGRRLAVIDAVSGNVHKFMLPAYSGTKLVGASTCYSVKYGAGSLFALRDPDGSIGRLDATAGTYAYTILVPLVPAYSIGFGDWRIGFGSIWVTATVPELQQGNLNGKSGLQPGNFHGVVARYDVSSGVETAKTDVGQAASLLALDPASGVWWIDQAEESLDHIDPTGSRVTRVPLHHFPCCVAAGNGRIWVGLKSP